MHVTLTSFRAYITIGTCIGRLARNIHVYMFLMEACDGRNDVYLVGVVICRKLGLLYARGRGAQSLHNRRGLTVSWAPKPTVIRPL